MKRNAFLKSLADYLRISPTGEVNEEANLSGFEDLLDLAFENMVLKNLDGPKIDNLMALMEEGNEKKVLRFLDQNISDWQFKLQQIILKHVR